MLPVRYIRRQPLRLFNLDMIIVEQNRDAFRARLLGSLKSHEHFYRVFLNSFRAFDFYWKTSFHKKHDHNAEDIWQIPAFEKRLLLMLVGWKATTIMLSSVKNFRKMESSVTVAAMKSFFLSEPLSDHETLCLKQIWFMSWFGKILMGRTLSSLLQYWV